MLAGIYEIKDPNGNDLTVTKACEKILKLNGIPSIRLRVEQPDFWEQVKNLSLFIMRFKHIDSDQQIPKDILPVVENEYGISCCPNQKASWHYDDNIKQSFIFKALGFSMTESFIFYDRNSALEFANIATFPTVLTYEVE